MQDPYNYPSLQKDNTMYLSTITKNDFATKSDYFRQSSFQKKDIQGTMPKKLIPMKQTGTNYSLSTFVQPIPNRFKQIHKNSNPLQIDDIQGVRPKACQFRTNRIVDPLQPKYHLATANPISIDNGRNFIKDPLAIDDIHTKSRPFIKQRGIQILKQTVQGSQPMALTKYLDARQRLQVKDINKDGIFETTRHVNPLLPTYKWKDNDKKPIQLNLQYGEINGTHPKTLHPHVVNKKNDLTLNVKDIQGTMSNSAFNRSHFMDKRKQFRNYMNIADIQKTNPSSLKKGIDTLRHTNPLMPNYKFPGHSYVDK